jgi:hypothetical protein
MNLHVPKAAAIPQRLTSAALTAFLLSLLLCPHLLLATAAQVRETGSQQSPFIEQLKAAHEAAQSAGKGIYNKVGAQPAANCASSSRAASNSKQGHQQLGSK